MSYIDIEIARQVDVQQLFQKALKTGLFHFQHLGPTES